MIFSPRLALLLLVILGAHWKAHAQCPPSEGKYVIDHDPAFVNWEFNGATKSPLHMPDADPASFVEIAPAAQLDPSKPCSRGRFAQDKTHIFYEYLTLEITPASLHAIGGEFAGSNELIFWKEKVIRGADSKTFKVLGNDIAEDQNRCYFRTEPFPIGQLRKLNADYLKLGSHIFYRGRELKPVDDASFEILSTSWAADAKSFFFRDQLIPGVDRRSFQVITEAFWADRMGVRPSLEVSNISSVGIPGLNFKKVHGIDKSAWKKLLREGCRNASGQDLCLTDGKYLIAIVELSGAAAGHFEIKSAEVSEVFVNPKGYIRFGSELFLHLKAEPGELPTGLRLIQLDH